MRDNIKILVMDVDGTLTDGKIYMGESGELFKAFDVKDGYAIKLILPEHNILPVIITARRSKILENRCKEMEVSHLYQGCLNKLDKLNEILKELSCGYESCAYIGDDLLDLQCMEPIKQAGGIVGAPADAVKKVKELADFVTACPAGNGAVREFIEYLIQ